MVWPEYALAVYTTYKLLSDYTKRTIRSFVRKVADSVSSEVVTLVTGIGRFADAYSRGMLEEQYALDGKTYFEIQYGQHTEFGDACAT